MRKAAKVAQTGGEDAKSQPLVLDRNLQIIVSITLVAMLGVSSITPALPAVARAFDITAREVSWLIAAFTVPGVFLSPVVGVLADRFGRKVVIVPSLALFAIAGGACAIVTDYNQLVILRLLQGLGGASLNTLNMTLVGDLFAGDRRVTVMGYTNGIIATTAAGFPLLGGAVALLGWRWVFGLPILGLPVAFLVLYALNSPPPVARENLGRYMRGMAGMMVDRNILLLFFTGFVIFTILYGPLVTYLPFLLEQRFGYSAVEVGIVLAANAAAGAIASFQLGRIVRRWRRKPIFLWSLALTAAPMTAIPFAESIWPVAVAAVISGGAMGACVALAQVRLVEMAPMERRGALMTLNGAMFRVGQTAGPMGAAALLAAGGMEAVFVGAGALAGLCLLLLLAAMKER